jgi:DNA sulfur modification protein DndD
MRIRSIELTNFRQFAGQQEFSLMGEKDRPVSLIFGANGAGKTNMLNAFTWTLYGEMSDDVEYQERMVTDSVWRATASGDFVEVAVELTLDHEGEAYRIRRSIKARKEADDQRAASAGVEMWVIRGDGSSETIEYPQPKIDSILPKRLARFFFFNGERIEKLVQKHAYAEVRQDIKTLLGLEVVERALSRKHLPAVEKKLSAELRKRGGERAAEIQDRIDQLRDQESGEREELAILTDQLATYTEERDGVEELLRQHQDAAPLQRELDRIKRELDESKTSMNAASVERDGIVGSKGFLAFTEDLVTRTSAMAVALHERGALPAPLKREFVDKLLVDGTCICGTALTEHTEPFHNVEAWRAKAGLAEVEAVWQKLGGQISEIASARQSVRSSLENAIGRVTSQRDRIHRLEEEDSDVRRQLSDVPLEDVQRLEAKRQDMDRRITDANRKIGSAGTALAKATKEIEQQVNELKNAKVTDELAAKARERLQLVHSVQAALQEILVIRSEDMRNRLDAKVKKVFADITFRPYIPILSQDFSLGLFQDVNGVLLPVPKSTGENQVLSLSFVAAVSELAREISVGRTSDGEVSADAGVFPIVMDAAFGSLDENYQREVARALAKMAPQLVVLVSKSQGLGKVLGELSPHLSHIGVIVTHTTLAGKASEHISLEGGEHPYIVAGADADYAELKVIR